MRADECVEEAVRQAMAGRETSLELLEPAGPHIELLVDGGMLAHLTPLLVRGGTRPRILFFPRRTRGMPTVTEVLGIDHARLDALLDRIDEQVRALDIGVAATAYKFAWSMRRHMWIEDHILFPLYERSSGVPLAPHLKPFRVEHACIEHYTSLLLAAAEGMASRDKRAAAAADLAHVHCGLVSVLSEHDAREEERLFPTIDHTNSFERRLDVLRSIVSFDPDVPSSVEHALHDGRE
jgi:iron-sulfur cluster repair protein YtfE (RIC family)